MKSTTILMIITMFIAPIALALALALALEPAAKPPDKQTGQFNNAFASDMYAQLAKKESNLFFSPTSIQIALAMTAAGARGATADEMAKNPAPGRKRPGSRSIGRLPWPAECRVAKP